MEHTLVGMTHTLVASASSSAAGSVCCFAAVAKKQAGAQPVVKQAVVKPGTLKM
jgi:hypothetical protein